MKTTDEHTENHLEVYGDSDWKNGWPETIVVFNTETRADEVYVRYRPTATAEPSKEKVMNNIAELAAELRDGSRRGTL